MADNIRATPQNPYTGKVASALRRMQQFAGQYQVDPRVPLLGGTSVDELLSLPGAASLMEDVSYNGPRALIRGGNAATGGIGTFKLDPRILDTAEFASNVSPLAMLAGRGTMAAGRAGERLAERVVPKVMDRGGMGAAALQALSSGTTSNVIKPKGGNWLAGSVEDSLKGLRNRRYEEAEYNYFNRMQAEAGGGYQDWLQAKWAQDPEYRNKPAFVAANEYLKETGQPLLPKEPINAWIDKQLTSYVKNEMATPEDPIRALAEKWAVDKPAKLAEAQARIDALASKIEQTAGQRGVPPEYLTSMRQQMIGLEKEKDLLQLREGLHYTPDAATQGQKANAALARSAGGYPAGGESVSDLAQAYELMTDSVIKGEPAANWRKFAPPEVQSRIPGLDRIPDEAMVYERTSPAMTQNLGFDHLIDELRNATTPDSGLPKELLLKYQDLPKITVPQAVERVADINAWRAAQKIEADMARANNAATQVFKEYPTIPGLDAPNEKGLRWVELRAPKDKPIVEGEYADPMFDIPPREQERIMDEAADWASAQGFEEGSDELMEAAIGRAQQLSAQYAAKNKPKVSKELEDALKYEGDTMQHCVGGYCPDVLEGRSRIYSLRDAKGQPHVTVEVKPEGLSRTNALGRDVKYEDFADYLAGTRPEGNLNRIVKQAGGDFDELFTNAPEGSTALNDFLLAQYPKEAAAYTNLLSGEVPQRITQIKGKANRAPNEEYLPYVQDFVKSGKWSDVGDLGNAGLQRADWQADTLEELNKFGIEAPTYGTAEEINKTINALNKAKGFARGGLVQYDAAKIDALTQQLQEELNAA